MAPDFTVEFSATAWTVIGGLPGADFKRLSREIERAAELLRERNAASGSDTSHDRLASLQVGELVVHYSVERPSRRIIIRGIARSTLAEAVDR